MATATSETETEHDFDISELPSAGALLDSRNHHGNLTSRTTTHRPLQYLRKTSNTVTAMLQHDTTSSLRRRIKPSADSYDLLLGLTNTQTLP